MYWIAFFNTNTTTPLPDPSHLYDDPRFEANLLCENIADVKDRMAEYPGKQIILQEVHHGWYEELYRGSDYDAAIAKLPVSDECG